MGPKNVHNLEIMKLRLKTLRTDRSWTIDHLADLSGLSRGYLSLLENGKRAPGPMTLQVLSEVFNCGIPDLIDGGEASADLAEMNALMIGLEPADRKALIRMAKGLRSETGEESA
jgi:transcriptional regulator with XRE-family HTH domain